ncbi:MAG: hypothetical protein OXU67_03050 [Chloroflexota bacterium]|nr:hypothetical protein [Chloroflexota bacterium]
MPRGGDTNHPPLGIVATTLTGVVIAGHLLLAAGYVYDDESRRQALLSTLLPSARPAFQPLSSDVGGYWLFIVAGLLCALGVTWLWQRWSRQHALTSAPATTLAAQWLVAAVAGLALGWLLASLAAAGHIGFLGGEPRHAAAALALGSLAVSLAVCTLLLLRTRASGTVAERWLTHCAPPAGPGAMLLLGTALLSPFLAPAYLQSIVQCGERCVPKWGPVNVLIGAGVVVALIAGIGLWRAQSHRWHAALGSAGRVGEPTTLGAWAAAAMFASGSAVAGFLLWLPDPWRPVGDAFGWDRLFHWSYTVLGPTLGVLHGGTPGVDIVAHHGLGLPIGIAALVQFGLELTYANLVRVQLIGTVLAFGLLAVLVRLLFGSILWASAAFVLALGLQFGGGWAAGTFAWWHPQLGFLRNPLEIALLLAIVQHWRTGAIRWLAIAALLATTSLWWVTDTGLANTLVLVVYVASRAALAGTHRAAALARAAGAAAAVLGAVAGGFLVLTLATVGAAAFDPRFWSALAEGPWLYGSAGLYARALDPFGLTTAHLYLTPALYVAFAAGIVAMALYRRAPASAPLLLALAAWGLLLYQHFIRGSEPSYWFRHSLPWVLIVTYLLAHAASRLPTWLPRRDGQNAPAAGGPALWLLLTGCVVLVGSFLSYPQVLWGREREAVECWSLAKASWCIDSARARLDLPRPETVAAGVAAIQRLVPAGEPAAVISPLDVLYLHLAERGPLWHHLPLDHQPPTPAAVERAVQRLTEQAPAYVFFDRDFPLGSNTALLGVEELAAALHNTLRRDYKLSEQAGALEVWRRAA